MHKVISFLVVSVVTCFLFSCEKDKDRCKCTETNTGDYYETSVEDQDCVDLNSGNYKCYPAD